MDEWLKTRSLAASTADFYGIAFVFPVQDGC
jgi:hypothetical protein